MEKVLDGVRGSLTATFHILLISFLVALLIQELKPGYIEQYLSMNYLLILVVVLGIVSIALEPKGGLGIHKIQLGGLTEKDYLFAALAGIIGACLICYKLSELGWLSFAISIVSGSSLTLLALVFMSEGGEEE